MPAPKDGSVDTRGVVPQNLMFRLDEAQSTLRAMIRDSQIPPTDRIAAAVTELDHIAEHQDATLTALGRALTDASSENRTRELLDEIVSGGLNTDNTIAALVKVSDGPLAKPSEQKMENRIRFRYQKKADRAFRSLGDTLITDILQPWAQRILTELEPHARAVVDHGAGTPGGRDPAYTETYRLAEALVTELHDAWKNASELRRRRVLPHGENIDTRRYGSKYPHRLADESTAHREPWWSCYALVNEAGLGVYTYAEAKARTPVTT